MALETKVDELMPKLHPRWKHLLLEESLDQVTGSEVARRILRERGRTDVKVCLSQDERNCYSPFLNLIGLSEDVAGSCSVMAVAIAAHEVGHALQARVIESFSRFLKNLSTLYWLLYWLSILGEMFMLIPHLFKVLFDFASFNKNEFQRQGFQEFKENQSRQHPKCYSIINLLRLNMSFTHLSDRSPCLFNSTAFIEAIQSLRHTATEGGKKISACLCIKLFMILCGRTS